MQPDRAEYSLMQSDTVWYSLVHQRDADTALGVGGGGGDGSIDFLQSNPASEEATGEYGGGG